MRRATVLYIVFLLSAHAAEAQRKWFDVTTPDTTVFLDFLVIPDSLVVIGANQWWFDAPTGMLRLRVDPPAEVYVSYQRLPVRLPSPLNRTRGDWQAPPVTIRPPPSPVQRSLSTSGSFTRGIQIGTNRDLTLESGLQIDVAGMITEDIRIIASLTDKSTPIQPDGSTQTLREFDQVYVRLIHPKGTLQMGDIDVKLEQGSFARLTRRLQGATATSRAGNGTYTAAAAAMRGTFNSVTLRARDGIQGPYRLTGLTDEPFVVVLAGTERVYLNGTLLERGEDRDYVIDYGLGEVTFTGRRLIRDDHRIVVDYQFLSSAYPRSLIAAEATSPAMLNGRLTLGFSYIREADDIRNAESIGLGQDERDILRLAGDNPALARIDGADSLGFRLDADIALYVRKDTVLAGTTYSIYEHRPGDPRGIYRVSFSRVEPGTGSYRVSASLTNAAVYRWVGPGQGDHEPFRILTAPREHQILGTRMSFSLTENILWESEWMMSAVDKNRYSPLDDDDNLDMGWRTAMRLQGRLSGRLEHRKIGRNVVFFDRVRDVEFDRNWNLPLASAGEETLNDADLRYELSENSGLGISGGRLTRGSFESSRAAFRLRTAEPGLPEITTDADWSSSTLGLAARFNGEALFRAAITPMFRWDSEWREAAENLRYLEWMPGARIEPTKWLRAEVFRSFRTDDRRETDRYLRSAESTTWEGEFTLEPPTWIRTQNRLILRHRKFATDPTSGVLDETSRGVTVRSDTDLRSPGRRFELRLSHQVSTESRSLLDETYLEVGPELGQYVWLDLNNDGVKQLDEFFPETTPNEGWYIRQYRPSDEVFPIVSLETRLQWAVDPRLAGIRYTGSLDLREQNRTSTPSDIYFLKVSAFQNDSTTINGRVRLYQEVDMFRNRADVSIRLSADLSQGKLRQFIGMESTRQHRYAAVSEYRFERFALVGMELEQAGRRNESPEAPFRNLDIDGWMLAPYVRFWPVSDAQGHIRFSVQQKKDSAQPAAVELTAWRIRTETNARLFTSWNLFAGVEYRSIRLQGNPSPLSEFELTDGAGRGQSVYWTMTVNVATSESVRASFQYDGRTRQSGDPIQTLRMTMTAAF